MSGSGERFWAGLLGGSGLEFERVTSDGAGELLEIMEMPRSGDNPDLEWELPAGAMTTIARAARGTVRAAARLNPVRLVV